jgi:hypothetical protein
MKNRILAFLLVVMTLASSAQAQLIDEIRTFVDSTELIMNNGRRMLYQSLATGDKDKADDLHNFLKEQALAKHCFAFNYNESLYICLLLNDWDAWLDNARNYKTIVTLSSCYQYNEDYVQRLYGLVIRNMESIQKKLDSHEMTTDERDLMQLYLHLLKVDKPDDLYSSLYKSFKRNHKYSAYIGFIEGYMPRALTKAAFAMSVGPTTITPTGNLNNFFNPGVLFNMSMDVNLNKIYSGFHVSGGALKLKQPVSFFNSNGIIEQEFKQGESFSFFTAGIYAGYFLVRNERWQLAPYINIGGSTLESSLYTSYDKEPEYQIFDSFNFGPGFHTEFRIAEFTLDPYYGALPGMETSSYISFKMDIGYDIVTNNKNIDFKGNFPYVRFGLVWGIGNY